ncbi:hypothetical protein PENARI_c003G10143 [Penicillium arizonense]|uniref:Alpha/beta hydrolase fold-3 domain-containing protein n=1 Tax=Penicillium arizonense TaxID=1835702 RepID=A0A1F5LS56_PENAI|nr:hypothetical protein PENARI_c003G10143 [Penicillium arizonense]OGE55936.1 hypothetical protein PENARI_c003G10143 [Penicillium arizonense]
MSLVLSLLKVTALLIRAWARYQGDTIKIYFYRPPTVSLQKQSPVLINFHRSGVVIPAHGSDDAFCRRLSQQTKYIIIDGQYCFAPEHSFLAALHDTEDAVNWVLGQPSIFDTSRVSIQKFSAMKTLPS